MAYNPATDFIGLWRSDGGTEVSKLEIPGLDFVISAMARAGLLTISISATAPGANQSTTAWLQTDVPSWVGEGSFYLWNRDTTTYETATPALFFQFLEACARVSGVSLWSSIGGPPLNTVGQNGDYSIRTDSPYGIYGPKTADVWPATPLPGSSNVLESSALDNTFGPEVGNMIFRGVTEWNARTIGALNNILTVAGGPAPEWESLSTVMDAVFSNIRGSVLYRGDTEWDTLPPSTDDLVLTTHGTGADPTWTPKVSEFTSGTSMLFRNTTAPPGWTKQTDIDNYGLRVVSGTPGTTAGTAFSSVFSQVATGNTTLTAAQMPSHSHTNNANSFNGGASTGGGAFPAVAPQGAIINPAGGDGPHSHPVSLALSYVDVIIATKD